MHSDAPLASVRQAQIALMEQDQHQQVVEDLVNDLLFHAASFVSTTTASPPRRRRQRPLPLEIPSGAASSVSLDAPLVRGPSASPAVAPPPRYPLQPPRTLNGPVHSLKEGNGERRGSSPTTSPQHHFLRAHSRERAPSRERAHSREASRDPSPTTAPQHDSLRSHSRRKFLWAPTSGHKSLFAHAPHLRHLREESALRAISLGNVRHAAPDTREHASQTMHRSQSAEPPSPPAQPLGHTPVEQLQLEQSLAPIRRVPSGVPRAGSVRNVASGLRSVVLLKAAAHAIIAAGRDEGGKDRQGSITSADLAMIQWEHQERLELAARHRKGGQETTNSHGLGKSTIFDFRNPTSTAPIPLEIGKSKIINFPKP
ncbi:hypothetical protein T484DRAFT_1939246 [Baffinella frigidus]|nr:hypothetical protein T484DRAFT_1939246 [Cryptophyta sp. CCMP2293]